jgi:hypothetical protein
VTPRRRRRRDRGIQVTRTRSSSSHKLDSESARIKSKLKNEWSRSIAAARPAAICCIDRRCLARFKIAGSGGGEPLPPRRAAAAGGDRDGLSLSGPQSVVGRQLVTTPSRMRCWRLVTRRSHVDSDAGLRLGLGGPGVVAHGPLARFHRDSAEPGDSLTSNWYQIQQSKLDPRMIS